MSYSGGANDERTHKKITRTNAEVERTPHEELHARGIEDAEAYFRGPGWIERAVVKWSVRLFWVGVVVRVMDEQASGEQEAWA